MQAGRVGGGEQVVPGTRAWELAALVGEILPIARHSHKNTFTGGPQVTSQLCLRRDLELGRYDHSAVERKRGHPYCRSGMGTYLVAKQF